MTLRRLAATLAACLLPACAAAPAPIVAIPTIEAAAPGATLDGPPAAAPYAETPPAPPLPPLEVFAAAAPEHVFAGPVVPRERTRAVVLLYHLFGSMDSAFAISPEAFDEQLQWLHDHHVSVVGTSDLLRFLDGAEDLPERVAVITIDDGHKSVFSRAYPLLSKHGLPFTLALNTAAIEGGRREAVTWGEVRAMMASGLCEIESHSHIHGHMDRLTLATNRSEVEVSRSILETRTGVRPDAFVFPFGGNDARVRKVVEEAGYRAAFAAWGRAVSASSPRFALPRVGVGRDTTLAAFARMFGG